MDGISLTVAGLTGDRFELMIIPFTMAHTNLRHASVGTPVNLEFDMVGKYVARAAEVAQTQAARATRQRRIMKSRMKIAKGARKPDQPHRPHRGCPRGVPQRADRSSSSTTRTARTRETSRLRPRRSRRTTINFMARHGRGLICLSMTAERLDELEIPLMVSQNTTRFDTAFCIPIEAKGRTTTGISAADRAATVHAAIDPATKPYDLAAPRPHVSASCALGRRAWCGQVRRKRQSTSRGSPASTRPG
ncbi:MAG: 3,4-dihydroxy-2-butanone-4-phosphate synthase [Vicinamibacterales bacterium]